MPSSLQLGRFEVLTRADGAPDVMMEAPLWIAYKGWDGEQLALVVIKALSPNASPVAQSHFLNEAKVRARLRHAYVARVIEVVESPESPYSVMEWCEGPSLQAWVGERGPISWAEALRFGRQLVEAVGAIYHCDLMPRNLCPDNLILTKDEDTDPWQVKVTEYGLAEAPSELSGDDQAGPTPSATVGYSAYMSPEKLIDFAPPEPRSDFYTIGAILWFCLTGRPMFEGSPFDVVLHHLNSEPNFAQLPSDVPPQVVALLRRMLSKSREDRPGSVEQLLAAIDGLGSESVAAPPSRPETPQVADRYQLLEVVLQDGMGTLWRAHDLKQDRMVALQLFASERVRDNYLRERLSREAGVAMRRPRPFWQNVLDCDLNAGAPHLVLEWVDGPTLLALLKARSILPLHEFGPLLLRLAEAVDSAASVSIGAVELAPERIWIEVSGWVGMLHSDQARWLRHPMSLWPTWRARVSPLCLEDERREDRHSLVANFLALCYRVLTGHARSTGSYTPSSSLTVEGNGFFERYLPITNLGGNSCAQMFRQLCQAEGLAAPARDIEAVASETLPGNPHWRGPSELEKSSSAGNAKLYRVTARIIVAVRLKGLINRHADFQQKARTMPDREQLEAERDWLAQERERLSIARRDLATFGEPSPNSKENELSLEESQRRIKDLSLLRESRKRACRKLEQELELGALQDLQQLRSSSTGAVVDLSDATSEPTLRNTEATFRWREAAKLGRLDQMRDELLELDVQLRQQRASLQLSINEQFRQKQKAKAEESLAREQISAEERRIEEWRKALDARWMAWQASRVKRRVYLISGALAVTLVLLMIMVLLPGMSAESRREQGTARWHAARVAMIQDSNEGRWLELLHDCGMAAQAVRSDEAGSSLSEAHHSAISHNVTLAVTGLLELGLENLSPSAITQVLSDLDQMKDGDSPPELELLAAEARMARAVAEKRGDEALRAFVAAAPLHPDFPNELSAGLEAALKGMLHPAPSEASSGEREALLEKVKGMLNDSDPNRALVTQIQANALRPYLAP